MDNISHNTDSDGNPNVFNVEHDDNDRWLNTNWDNSDNHWNGNNRWVFLRRYYLHFSPYLGRVLFSWPFQPPSILPISSKVSESAPYFLLSSDLVSHKTISKILRVSVLRIANLT